MNRILVVIVGVPVGAMNRDVEGVRSFNQSDPWELALNRSTLSDSGKLHPIDIGVGSKHVQAIDPGNPNTEHEILVRAAHRVRHADPRRVLGMKNPLLTAIRSDQ
jgi:hypothetical protein